MNQSQSLEGALGPDFDPTLYLPDRGRFQDMLHDVIVPVAFGVITLLGIVGNVLVICVIAFRNKMRSATNLLLLNLALADLLFVIVLPPITAYANSVRHWSFGPLICKLMHYFVNVSVYVTVYSLVIIAFIRYLTIVHSQRTLRIRAPINVLYMMLGLWLAMLVVNIPVLFIYSALPEAPEYPAYSTWACTTATITVARNVAIVNFVFSYVLPLFVILLFSLAILRFIRKQRPQCLDSEAQTRGHNRKRQASRILVIVIALFALLWLPVHVHLIVTHIFYESRHVETNWYELFRAVFHILAYSNSCINPLVYNFVSKDFRDGFSDVVMCRRADVSAHVINVPATKTTTGQLTPESRHKGRPRTDTELVPLSNGHVTSHGDNGFTCDTELEAE